MSYGNEWHKRNEEASAVVRDITYTCESHACQHPDRAIVIGIDKRGTVQTHSEEGLVGTMTGWRHRLCPDPRLRQEAV